jgi:NH3-dependent NAD+ synthetase
LNIALLQINPTVGDLAGNARLIADAAREAANRGADLAITPELSLVGYLPRDLLLSEGFVRRSWEQLGVLAQELSAGPPVLVGLPEPNPSDEGRPLFNTAALIRGGAVEHRFRKSLLPTYDVFDEDRYFEPFHGAQLLDIGGMRLGISVCEDVWNDRDFWKRRRYHHDPIEELVRAGAQAILNLSASPFVAGKQRFREKMLGSMARRHRVPVAYVNQFGGNDDLVFDGRSCVFDATGSTIGRGRAFEADVLICNLAEAPALPPSDDPGSESEIWRALVLGTRDYARKCGFERSLLGLSGGIDSALTAAVAAEALGADRVLGVLMPLSNKRGALLLTTGNKSELAVGYCTLYGDMSGGLGVIADVPKTMVYRVARWLNGMRGTPIIPEAVLTKAPSAELRPGQTDQDSLPPYDILDDILQRHIERHEPAETIIAAGFDADTVRRVVRLVRGAEFKRKQAAPGLKVTDRAFGTGWRMPIAAK